MEIHKRNDIKFWNSSKFKESLLFDYHDSFIHIQHKRNLSSLFETHDQFHQKSFAMDSQTIGKPSKTEY